jgi:hypothetical protein
MRCAAILFHLGSCWLTGASSMDHGHHKDSERLIFFSYYPPMAVGITAFGAIALPACRRPARHT